MELTTIRVKKDDVKRMVNIKYDLDLTDIGAVVSVVLDEWEKRRKQK